MLFPALRNQNESGARRTVQQNPGGSSRRLDFSEHFRFGVPELDGAHAELIDILNETRAPDADRQAISDQLHRFSEAYATHCRVEEIFLRSVGYGRLSEHVAKHRALARQIDECCRAFQADPTADRQVIDALCEAFMEHMLYDLQFKSHLDEVRGR